MFVVGFQSTLLLFSLTVRICFTKGFASSGWIWSLVWPQGQSSKTSGATQNIVRIREESMKDSTIFDGGTFIRSNVLCFEFFFVGFA